MRGAVGDASVAIVYLASAEIYPLPVADTEVNPNKSVPRLPMRIGARNFDGRVA
jgi:hypothetical protein